MQSGVLFDKNHRFYLSILLCYIDLFKCGGCQRNYHELDEFIAHKKECDAEQDAEESENTAEEADQSPKGVSFLRFYKSHTKS